MENDKMKLLHILNEVVKKKTKTPTKAKVVTKPEKKITINEITLLKIAEVCRTKIIGSRQAKFGDCEPVSFAIAKALSRLVPDIKVADGFWRGEFSNGGSARGHVWCYIPSKRIIIDASHDQFNKDTKIKIIDENHEDFENYSLDTYYRDDLLKKYITEPEFADIEVL